MIEASQKLHTITVDVNGARRTASVEPRTLLVHLIRDEFGLTGTHIGCDTSQCGACTVDIDGKAVKSCTVLAVMADGSSITTIEGLASVGSAVHPHPGGISGASRLAVRFLHARNDHAHTRIA